MDSDLSIVTATVTTSEVIDETEAVIDAINVLDFGLLKNQNMKKNLTNRLNAVIQMVEQGLCGGTRQAPERYSPED